MAHPCHCCLETKSPLNSTFTNMHQVNQYLSVPVTLPKDTGLCCVPLTCCLLSQTGFSPTSLGESDCTPGPLYPPAEASWARRAAAASPRMGTRRQAYLNTYCVPATTVDSAANGTIVTSSAYEEIEVQKNYLPRITGCIHGGARIRDQGCVSPHLNSPRHTLAPGGMVWVSDLSQDLLGPEVPLCLSDWLLLQTPSLVFQEGEPIMLRCHSWRNQPLNKITFYQDRKSKIFSYQRTNFSIPRANLSHSGQYHCTAFIGKMLHSSQPVNITVQGGDSLKMKGWEKRRWIVRNKVTWS